MAEQASPQIHTSRPADRRSRFQRSRNAVAELLALQARYAAWYDAPARQLHESFHESATAETLQAIVDLNLDDPAAIVPPRSYGRD